MSLGPHSGQTHNVRSISSSATNLDTALMVSCELVTPMSPYHTKLTAPSAPFAGLVVKLYTGENPLEAEPHLLRAANNRNRHVHANPGAGLPPATGGTH